MPEDFLTQNEEVFESINNDIDSAALAGEEAVMRAQNEQYESLKKSERRKKIITAAAWTASVGGVAAAFATGLFVFALPIIAMAGWKTQSYLESKKIEGKRFQKSSAF